MRYLGFMDIPNMIQRVHVVIEVGLDDEHVLLIAPMTGPYDIPPEKHYRDERAIAKVLREVADQLEDSMGFQGWVPPKGATP